MRALEDDLSFAREENEGLRNRLTELSSQNEMAQRQLADSALVNAISWSVGAELGLCEGWQH